MSELLAAREERTRAEVQRAVRALLASPLLTADGDDADDFVLVRRHAAELRAFFGEHVGWTLHVDREMARLRKIPSTLTDATRPARARPKDPPFSRRRYVLACLALAALERSDRQTTLRKLAEAVAAMVAEDDALRAAGIDFELSGRDQRRDLVAAIRWLLERRVLRRVEGEEEAFVADQGDVLYQVDRSILAWMLACPRPPSTVEVDAFDARVTALAEELELDSDEMRRRGLRHRLARRLLDDPVMYYEDLTREEHDYLTRSRAALLRRLTEMTGLVAEVRVEGIALVDPLGDATDLALPEEGTDGHATLLLAEQLADHARARPGVALSLHDVHEQMRELAHRHRTVWRKAATEPGAEVELARFALDHLEGLGLVARRGDSVLPRAAIARFALGERPPEQQELWR